MPTVNPIKKNDEVAVLRGKDRGKTGRVLMIKRHTRPNPQKNIQGGIVEREAPIHISNVAIVCKNCKKGVRMGSQVLADGRRVRICRKCGTAID